MNKKQPLESKPLIPVDTAFKEIPDQKTLPPVVVPYISYYHGILPPFRTLSDSELLSQDQSSSRTGTNSAAIGKPEFAVESEGSEPRHCYRFRKWVGECDPCKLQGGNGRRQALAKILQQHERRTINREIWRILLTYPPTHVLHLSWRSQITDASYDLLYIPLSFAFPNCSPNSLAKLFSDYFVLRLQTMSDMVALCAPTHKLFATQQYLLVITFFKPATGNLWRRGRFCWKGQENMTIKLIDAAKFYKALPGQIKAFEYLQSILNDVQLAQFAELYRSTPKPLISKEAAEFIFGCSVSDELMASLNSCLNRFEINTPIRMRHFISQIAHESNGLQYMSEIWGPTEEQLKYDWNEDLGNIRFHDGKLFRGAGPLQVTGRKNHTAFARYVCDSEVEKQGTDYVVKKYPFEISGFWWSILNKMNAVCDRSPTVEAITLRVNGGYNGLDKRKEYFQRACSVI